ncbi:MAG TPA: hypothetical protein VEL70_02920 [Candidatus Acidoferrum sp.]|nr:hypothetical protein [Candidatus Acidoferrum sp.]
MVCINICERVYSKIIFGKSHYEGDNKRNPVDGMKSVSVMTANSFHAMEWHQDLLLLTEKDKDKIKRSTLRIAIAKIYGWTMIQMISLYCPASVIPKSLV